MNVAIRVDSGYEIGSGHVMRCLTLAEKLRREGHRVAFLTKPHTGNIIDVIVKRGFCVHIMQQDEARNEDNIYHAHWLGGSQLADAEYCIQSVKNFFLNNLDWMVVDHYGLSYVWEKKIKAIPTNLLVLDDLADRRHSCDVLVDQTYGRDTADYKSLVPRRARLLVGSKYAILRDEFSIDAETVLSLRQSGLEGKRNTVLIMLGGTDHKNITLEVLRALKASSLNVDIIAVLGVSAKHREEVEAFCVNNGDVKLLVGVENVAELMLNSFLCVGAPGTSSWERCALGLPTIVIPFAENQLKIAATLMQRGVSYVVDPSEIENKLAGMVDTLIGDPAKYMSMVKASLEIGCGAGANLILGELQ